MQVLELLSLMGNLSLGNDNITATERALFLQYLNLAHMELYQGTANLNQDLLIQEIIPSQQGQVDIVLGKIPYSINSVYDFTHKKKLNRISLVDIIERDPSFSERGQPCEYVLQKNTLSFFPVQPIAPTVSVWYVPQPSLLTEKTDETTIPYPLAYHPVLVDGALYYLFQEEGGFKNSQKATQAQSRWDIGKTRLQSYLVNSSGQRFSTFSSL